MSRRTTFKAIVFLTALVLMLGLLVGCGKAKSDSQGDGLSGSINIAGSTSVQPLSDELAQAFMDENPDVKINVVGGGSSAGIKAAQEGTADIGASSRELEEGEKNVKIFEIAKDGIAVVVNPANELDNLTLDQVAKIFLGEINNWSQVGGKDAPITVVTREDGSGTRGAFEEIVLGKDKQIFSGAAIQNSTGAVRTAVASDPNSIGYVSIGALSEDVKPIMIDGVEATEENVLAGKYKISRPFLYLTKEEPTGVVKAFIDWVLSDEGQAIVGEEYIPVKHVK
ncbi:phosphate ABC transporter substrate-binding protein [Zhaonella formicivorans]|uniref:phosphate ABC transporter substrate-binding protein n=1 Tax=Zhaonella formicivorans TaxID=2528593 RepID=UPI001D116431|nr:phosphate ABC transporter substrate-binding protein [Zhaonella formicivorans]